MVLRLYYEIHNIIFSQKYLNIYDKSNKYAILRRLD